MIHTVKGFSVVNKAEIDVILEFSCFLYGTVDVGSSSPGFLPFVNPACTSGISRFMSC